MVFIFFLLRKKTKRRKEEVNKESLPSVMYLVMGERKEENLGSSRGEERCLPSCLNIITCP